MSLLRAPSLLKCPPAGWLAALLLELLDAGPGLAFPSRAWESRDRGRTVPTWCHAVLIRSLGRDSGL